MVAVTKSLRSRDGLFSCISPLAPFRKRRRRRDLERISSPLAEAVAACVARRAAAMKSCRSAAAMSSAGAVGPPAGEGVAAVGGGCSAADRADIWLRGARMAVS
jgi:hypothetical protein